MKLHIVSDTTNLQMECVTYVTDEQVNTKLIYPSDIYHLSEIEYVFTRSKAYKCRSMFDNPQSAGVPFIFYGILEGEFYICYVCRDELDYNSTPSATTDNLVITCVSVKSCSLILFV